MVGSLAGVAASQRVTEARKGKLKLEINQLKSAIAYACLTVRQTCRVGRKSVIVIRWSVMERPSLNE